MTWSITRSSMLVLLLLLAGATTHAETTRIAFSQLDDLIRERSPGQQIIDLDYQRTLAARDRDMQWSNPALSLDREDVGLSPELQLSIGKEIELPWVRNHRRASWDHMVTIADLDRQQRSWNLLTDVKAGYVTLKLNQQYFGHLDQLQKTLSRIGGIAEEKRSEGHLSAIDERLIKLAVISLNKNRLEALQQQRSTRAHWIADAGLDQSDSLELMSAITFEMVELNSDHFSSTVLGDTPTLRAGRVKQQALDAQVSLAQASRFRSVSVYGGFKQIDPGFNGYVAGLALQLPIMNQNKAAVRGVEAEREIGRFESQRLAVKTTLEAEGLVRTVRELQDQLAPIADQFEGEKEHLDRLITSYEEGWMGLTELLNAIQIETNGLGDFHAMLISYYETLFRLEALSGTTLVRF